MNYYRYGSKIRFAYPLNGDCLNKYDGEEKDGVLYVKVKIEADKTSKIEVNQFPAAFNGECFEVTVPISAYRTNLVAKDENGNTEKIVVFKLKNPTEIYRLSSDDNILFLQDINDHKDTYKSIFENPYLAMYKEAHDKYGANVQLNIHYEFDPEKNPYFTAKRDFFDLSMMTDKFKDEFIANSSWLKLSFHAKVIEIDRPYINTDMNTITNDALDVYREIIRFAGEETLSSHNTTIHWGECTVDGMRGLRNIGLKGAYGYFNVYGDRTSVSYFYPVDFVNYLHNRDFWYDTEEDILYGKIDSVLNHYSNAEETIAAMEAIKANPNQYGCVEIMIHEEYFYEDYSAYIPNFAEIVHTACKWCADNGYKGYYMPDVVE